MSFSYTNTDIAASGTNYISFVRFTIDDKTTVAYELEDEEITALYSDTSTSDSQTSRNYQTAVKCAEYLVNKYAKMASFSSGGTSVQLAERAKAWADVANTLRLKLLAVDGVALMIYADRPASYTEYFNTHEV